MDRTRVYLVARELGLPSREVMDHLAGIGRPVRSHLAMVDEDLAGAIRRDLGRAGEAGKEPLVPFGGELHQRQPLLLASLATFAVAIAPSLMAFNIFVFAQPSPRPLLATILAIALTGVAVLFGSAIWATQPESEGFAFGDLMLWSWVRREWAEQRLVRATALLGFDRSGTYVGPSQATRDQQLQAVHEIAAALDAKSSYTLNHSRRVEKHARKVALALGLTEGQIERLATAAKLHDIGNIRIPDHLLRKAGELTLEERSEIEAHVLLGAVMVSRAGNVEVVKGIRHHHERWDGSGYPSGLRGEDIPLFARIVAIAEAFDAMTSTRPYRQGLSQQGAIAVLREEAGAQFDGELVEVFVGTLPQPLFIVEEIPALRWLKGQFHEMRLVFRRMGAVALSATASTIAIALILGSTVLNHGIQQEDRGSHSRRPRLASPPDRVLAERLSATEVDAPVHERPPFDLVTAATAPAMVADDGTIRSRVSGDVDVDGPGKGGDPDDGEPGDGGPGDGGPGGNPGGGNPGGGGSTPPGGGGGGVNPPGGGTTPPGGGSGGGVIVDPDGPIDPTPGDENEPDKPGKAPDHSNAGGNGKGNGHGEGKGKDNDHGKPDSPGNSGGNGKGKPASPGNSGDTGNSGSDGGGKDDSGKPASPGNSGDTGNSGSDGGGKDDSGKPASPGNSGGSGNSGGGAPSDSGSNGNGNGSSGSNGNGNSDSGGGKEKNSAGDGDSSDGASSSGGDDDHGNSGGNGNGNGNSDDKGNDK